MIDNQRLLNRFLDLVQIDSETGNELPVAQYLEPILKDLGFEVFYDKANDKFPSNTGNLIARLGDTTRPEALLLSAHMDTVVPGIGVKPQVREGYVYSDGTTILGGDDKAGIVAILEAVSAAKDQGIEIVPIEIVFCIAEEGGLNGSRYLDYSLIHARRGIVLDSGGAPGEIIVTAPAQDRIEVQIKGKPAHAGVCPEEGISAIQVAALAINRMQLLRIDEQTTANIGIIQGGQATNIVCPEVYIKAEARSQSNDKLEKQTAHMVKCFEEAAEAFNAVAHVTVERAYDAFQLTEETSIVKDVVAAMKAIGFTPVLKGTGGGSDTNNFNKNGVEALNLGVGMEKVHTLEERISLQNLENAAKLVLQIIRK